MNRLLLYLLLNALACTVTSAQTWQNIGFNSNHMIDEIVVASDSSILILANQVSPTLEHRVWQSFDNGMSWQDAVTNIPQGMFQRALLINYNEDYLLGVRDALNNDAYIAKINNAVTTYNNKLYSDSTDGIFSLDRINSVVYASGEECAVGNISCQYANPKGTVYKSNDDGESWRRLENFPGSGGHDIQVLDTNKVFVKSRISKAIYYSLNSGDTWDSINAPNNENIVGFRILNDTASFVGTLSGKLYYTSNLGLSWNLTHTVSNQAVSKIGKAGNYLVAASTGKVAISKDNGLSWVNESLPQNRVVYDLDIAPNGVYLACDKGHVYLKQQDLSQYFLEITTRESKNHFSVFPNPAKEILEVQIPEAFTPTIIKCFAMNGREVAVEYQLLGNQIWIDCKLLPHGMYSLFLGNKEYSYHEKFIKE